MVRVYVLAFASRDEFSMTCGACWWLRRSCSRMDGQAVGRGCGQNGRPTLTQESVAQIVEKAGSPGRARTHKTRCRVFGLVCGGPTAWGVWRARCASAARFQQTRAAASLAPGATSSAVTASAGHRPALPHRVVAARHLLAAVRRPHAAARRPLGELAASEGGRGTRAGAPGRRARASPSRPPSPAQRELPAPSPARGRRPSSACRLRCWPRPALVAYATGARTSLEELGRAPAPPPARDRRRARYLHHCRVRLSSHLRCCPARCRRLPRPRPRQPACALGLGGMPNGSGGRKN
ncbi:hypothetical protein PVAP13_6NG149720 [Panicum virgatum]|uniref:Uncharacterized protein n=1 Tax=Panicum virgatum TaxID=38727 RepID=A0A8T0QUQ1_PANVG|nr:hypothetical protein PVAP13_6NG149720 [Panicum virgatum]